MQINRLIWTMILSSVIILWSIITIIFKHLQCTVRDHGWLVTWVPDYGFLVSVIILIVGNLFPYHLTITFTAPLSLDKGFYSLFLFKVMKGFSDSLPNFLKRWEMHETSLNWQATINRHFREREHLDYQYVS